MVSAATFELGGIIASPVGPWELTSKASAIEDAPEDHQPCVALSPSGASIRIAPMDPRRHNNKNPKNREIYAKWKKDANFHDTLRAPSGAGGVTVLFEAMARESVCVVLSPETGFVAGKTFEVFLGAQGNMMTTLQRKGGPVTSKHAAASAEATADETTEDADKEEGVKDKPAAATTTHKEGIHVTVPSRVCQERAWTSYWICLTESGKLAAGIGKVPGELCIAVLNDETMQAPDGTSDDTPVRYYVGVGNAATSDRQPASPLKVRGMCVTTVPYFLDGRLDAWSADNEDTPMEILLVGGSDADAPDAETQALLKEYQEECQKAKARAAKFGIPYKEPDPNAFLPWSQARRLRANPKQGFITGLDLYDPVEKAKQDARKRRFGNSGGADDETKEEGKEEGADKDGMETEASVLPVVQAWDNEAFVRSQRVDPPTVLWKNPPTEASGDDAAKNDFITAETPTMVPEKVHIFSLDWAAFKQIRTNDLMAHFSIYGPSYVEWLGDLGANILFEDKFSAKRALESLSQELPTPPPDDVAPPKEGESLPDFGSMGWRLCNKAVRKVSNDRHGRRGTTARLLMRAATSIDSLKERPSKWPKPPPGFSTKRILGPGSDFDRDDGRKRQKRSRPDRDSERDTHGPTPLGPDGEHPLLSGGLRSSR